MSVAETRVTERAPRRPYPSVAVGSLVGGLGLLAALWVVFAGLPMLWEHVLRVPQYTNDFLSTALLMVVALTVGGALVYAGHQLLRGHDDPGLRAGVFVAALLIFVALWVAVALGNTLEARDVMTGSGGLVVVAIIAAGLLGAVAFLFTTPGWGRLLQTVENQGWFSAVGYKHNQGVRVRRGTVIGLLTLGVTGIITMATHRMFGSERLSGTGANDWYWTVPFTTESAGGVTESLYVPLMFKMHLLMPIILGGLLLWFAWRAVNIPVFADFLIATEAEMNKVSWTTRRRLFQDTIVVLVTVFLFTAFLFFTDLLWINVLSNSWVGVLKVDVRAEQQKLQEKTQW